MIYIILVVVVIVSGCESFKASGGNVRYNNSNVPIVAGVAGATIFATMLLLNNKQEKQLAHEKWMEKEKLNVNVVSTPQGREVVVLHPNADKAVYSPQDPHQSSASSFLPNPGPNPDYSKEKSAGNKTARLPVSSATETPTSPKRKIFQKDGEGNWRQAN